VGLILAALVIWIVIEEWEPGGWGLIILLITLISGLGFGLLYGSVALLHWLWRIT
jgi:hypothetical protein